MNQSGLYYTLIFCCLAYIILVGQRFTLKTFSFLPSKTSNEPAVIITHPPSLFISNTQAHLNNNTSIASTSMQPDQEKQKFVANKLGIETQEEENEHSLSSDQLPYFVGTLAKISESVLPQNLSLQQEGNTLAKDNLQQSDVEVNEPSKKIDEFSQQLKLVLSALYHACTKVNDPLLIDRIEARLHLATMVVPGVLGRCFDCVIARALPRYFSQDGAFYSYQHDPYIMEDLITLLQYQYILPNKQRKALYGFRQEIMVHPFNKRLNIMIHASQQKDKAMLERVTQPYNPLISLMYQELALDS